MIVSDDDNDNDNDNAQTNARDYTPELAHSENGNPWHGPQKGIRKYFHILGDKQQCNQAIISRKPNAREK